jgi:hypothetical protein
LNGDVAREVANCIRAFSEQKRLQRQYSVVTTLKYSKFAL